MTATLFTEYGDQNRRRKYPFSDDATVTDADGVPLPADFIVDAALYPIDTAGDVYVSSVDTGTHTVTLSDGGGAFASAVWDGEGPADVTESADTGRVIGCLCFGPGAADVFRGRGVRTFTAADTAFSACAGAPLSQSGCRGFRLPDGTIVTGAVEFVGEDGVEVSAGTDASGPWLRFDVVGVPVAADDYGLGVPVRTLAFIQEAGSRLRLSLYDAGVIAITYADGSLPDLCAQTSGVYRSETTGAAAVADPCNPGDDQPGDGDNAGAAVISVTAADVAGNVSLAAPSGGGYINPVSVQPQANGLIVTVYGLRYGNV